MRKDVRAPHDILVSSMTMRPVPSCMHGALIPGGIVGNSDSTIAVEVHVVRVLRPRAWQRSGSPANDPRTRQVVGRQCPLKVIGSAVEA